LDGQNANIGKMKAFFEQQIAEVKANGNKNDLINTLKA
jgi:hypothetical protein